MKLEKSSRLPSQCPYSDCQAISESPETGQFTRKDSYYRSSDSRWVSRFVCFKCNRSFSQSRFSPCFRQKRRKLNAQIEKLLVSGVSQRRIAKLLGTTRNTVAKKFLFLARQAKEKHQVFLQSLKEGQKLSEVYFDEMESFERSKCLPVSIPLAVDPKNRKILAFRVCSMPAKGPLAAISRKKYGMREDQREEAANSMWSELKPCIVDTPLIVTDQNPKYSNWIRPHFPKATHKAYKGRRGCVVGQGELKRGGFDPLFELNHTAAMLRANINRLFRRTWCTTKLKERLEDHIALYAKYHNEVLTELA